METQTENDLFFIKIAIPEEEVLKMFQDLYLSLPKDGVQKQKILREIKSQAIIRSQKDLGKVITRQLRYAISQYALKQNTDILHIPAFIMTTKNKNRPCYIFNDYKCIYTLNLGPWLRYAPESDIVKLAKNNWEFAEIHSRKALEEFLDWHFRAHVFDPEFEEAIKTEMTLSDDDRPSIVLRLWREKGNGLEEYDENSIVEASKWLALNRPRIFSRIVKYLREETLTEIENLLLREISQDKNPRFLKQTVNMLNVFQGRKKQVFQRLSKIVATLESAAAGTEDNSNMFLLAPPEL